MKRPTVYIVNRSTHDYSRAEEYGDLLFLSEGPMDRYEPNAMVRQFTERLRDSSPNDYLVMCALSMMNSVAMTIFVLKHDCVNLLLYRSNRYEERNLKGFKMYLEEMKRQEKE